MTTAPAWPKKTREIRNFLMDFDALERLRLPRRRHRHRHLVQVRHDLDAADRQPAVFQGNEKVFGQAISPGSISSCGPTTPAGPQQTHRRFMKTHLPLDALVFSPCAKYLYIAATYATWCGASTTIFPASRPMRMN